MPSVTVEFYIDGAWTDFTRLDADTHVLADDSNGVSISCGRSEAQGEVPPLSVKFDYLDNNCVLDGENPYSAYFQKIGIGTPIRIKESGDVRAVVELKSMTAHNDDIPDVVIWTIEGAGILDRLTAGQKPLGSAAYRALSAAENDTARLFYAPLEEEDGADSVAVFDNDGQLDIGLGVQFGASSSVSSARLATLPDGAGFIARVTPYSGTEHKVCMLWKFPSDGFSPEVSPLWLATTGNINTLRMYVDGANVRWESWLGNVNIADSPTTDWTGYIDDGQEFFLSVELTQDGADLELTYLIIAEDGTAAQAGHVFTSTTVTRVISVHVGPLENLEGSAIGQLIVGNDTNAFNNYINGNNYARGTTGFLNEPAAVRIDRLLDEEGVTHSIEGPDGLTPVAGTQGEGTLGTLLQDMADIDVGILSDQRDALAVQYRTRLSLYNQPPTVSLVYASSHLSAGLVPKLTDLRLANIVSASRVGGSSVVYEIPDDDMWHWSTEEAPDGAGPRDTGVTLNVAEDAQLNEIAAWVAHVSSWREKRIATLTVNLSRSAFTSGLRTALRAAYLGDVITINTTGAPRYLPYSEVRLMVQGYEEFINQSIHIIAFNTTPADPYEVEAVTSGPTSTLAAPITNSATSVKIAPGDGPSWSTADEPFHIQVGGDVMTVTAITDDTVAHIATAAGSFADNASVSPALPGGITVDTGQLLLCFAACRQTGAGVIGNAPTGWTTIVSNAAGDVKLFGKYYVTGDSAPTVTTSGGAAGNTVAAQIAAFSGLSMVLDKNVRGRYDDGYTLSVNSSAQNIAFTPLLVRRTKSVVLVMGRKDDDWTSVAQLASMTEIGDTSSTTGNDIGLAWDLYNPGTPTLVSASSLAVTGGASAVSDGMTVGLRPLQTATVTRGVAGVAVSASVGAVVKAWRPGVTGL